ncbi:glycoside hydrolase family 2 TIM barrel-domain containing protein [Verrucomicrobiota bacterium]
MKRRIILFAMGLIVLATVSHSLGETGQDLQGIVSLNGSWQIAQGKNTEIPAENAFDRKIPVPGLVDLAEPAFTDLNSLIGYGQAYKEADHSRSYWAKPKVEQGVSFYYRRTFSIDSEVPALAQLKIHKVKYGCSVYLNGVHVGDGKRSFTPLHFNVTKALRGKKQDNELIIRVGGDLRDKSIAGYPDGFDKEKERYYPGIYDDVELLLRPAFSLDWIQVAPQPDVQGIVIKTQCRFISNWRAMKQANFGFVVRDPDTGNIVAKSYRKLSRARGRTGIGAYHNAQHSHFLSLPTAELWSPEHPKLYVLEVTLYERNKKTGIEAPVHSIHTRFGMRSFRINPVTGRAVLNGKERYLRGTNICMYRFFEDPKRKALPWDEKWVRGLFQRIKDLNMDSLRFTIGFPPDFWYDIADEMGIMIQDEYPFWDVTGILSDISEDTIVECFTAWMIQRWNHPSVVAWDAQNETNAQGRLLPVVDRVRGLDLCNRPWNGGYDNIYRYGDFHEAHDYHYLWAAFAPKERWPKTKEELPKMGDYAAKAKRWNYSIKKPVPTISNEYCSLWLNRDGSAAKLSEYFWPVFLGKSNSTEKRREWAARFLAQQTEILRHSRARLGIHHFVMLTFSDPGKSWTGDNFINLTGPDGPVLEPNVLTYFKDSFAPVGIMIDLWDQPTLAPGSTLKVPVSLINDLAGKWQGSLRLELRKGTKIVSEQDVKLELASLGKLIHDFELIIPKKTGSYELVAGIEMEGKKVNSYRVIHVEK